MKTLRDCSYDGPEDVRSMLREQNGELFEVRVSVANFKTEDYLIGRILVHPTTLILKTDYTVFSFPIDSIDYVDWNYQVVDVSVDHYIWRFEDDGRIKVYRRDSKGDHLIQQRAHRR